MGRRRALGLAGMGSLALSLCACSGITQFGTPVASYQAANVFMPSGYSETQLDANHYQVTATGTEATPKERVEKIARARAAQIGVEQKLAYFKVAGVQHSVRCTERQSGYKSEATPPSSRPTVVLDVVYASDPSDPSFASSAQAFEALSAELASEVVAPEAKVAAGQETRASCGRG